MRFAALVWSVACRFAVLQYYCKRQQVEMGTLQYRLASYIDADIGGGYRQIDASYLRKMEFQASAAFEGIRTSTNSQKKSVSVHSCFDESSLLFSRKGGTSYTAAQNCSYQ